MNSKDIAMGKLAFYYATIVATENKTSFTKIKFDYKDKVVPLNSYVETLINSCNSLWRNKL